MTAFRFAHIATRSRVQKVERLVARAIALLDEAANVAALAQEEEAEAAQRHPHPERLGTPKVEDTEYAASVSELWMSLRSTCYNMTEAAYDTWDTTLDALDEDPSL